jgi:predicted nucleic acid-binding protein
VRFWDSSAIVPLLVGDPLTQATVNEVQRDPEMIVWWGTPVECVSALARLERESKIDAPSIRTALDRLDALMRAWHEIQPVERVRQTANRLLRVHALRGADALQLGAAIVASEDRPDSLTMVTLDDRLARAADREGFKLVLPSSPA